ncbi:hypothetical protein N7526_007753 [Penicillium atrosanguineum]|nr:hypothetical protein N7526_007753 [Penicillium atrosanguineum]
MRLLPKMEIGLTTAAAITQRNATMSTPAISMTLFLKALTMLGLGLELELELELGLRVQYSHATTINPGISLSHLEPPL